VNIWLNPVAIGSVQIAQGTELNAKKEIKDTIIPIKVFTKLQRSLFPAVVLKKSIT